jgi:hypothetical protein
MTTQPVLVTGATGDTGGYAIDALADADVGDRPTPYAAYPMELINHGVACRRNRSPLPWRQARRARWSIWTF